MLKFALIFLAFIACFVLLLRGAVIFMGRITGKYVGEKHREAETIINTGNPPKSWTYGVEKKIGKDSRNSDRVEKLQRKVKNTCLQKLERLIKYFKTSPLVKDEETRKTLLDELVKVRHRWKKRDWQKIIVPELIPPSVRT